MLKNYMKITFRNLIHRKTFSLINISGLALGMAGAILILLWAQDEISYDRFHAHGKDICKVYLQARIGNETMTIDHTFGGIAADLRNRYPDVINSTRYFKVEEARLYVAADRQNTAEKFFIERNMVAVDTAFLTMFTFPLVKGNPASALTNPNAILLTENMAEKYCGSQDPIGKTISIDKLHDMQVTGVLKNVPHNSDFQFDFVVPTSYIERHGGNINGYNNTNCTIFLQLKNGALYGALNQKIQKEFDKTLSINLLQNLHHYLVPLEKVHLYGYSYPPRIVFIYVFFALAIFILLIACINFINLSTARSILRAKEIGLRKAIGASRSKLIRQFLVESIMVATIALIISLMLLELALPFFNLLTFKHLAIAWFDFHTWLGLISIVIVTGVLAGWYPAFYLSSFNPNQVLRGQTVLTKAGKGHSSRARLRKTLVVAQFTLTIILIIDIINGARLDRHMNDLGFDKDNVVYIQNHGIDYDVFKARLLADPAISHVTTASALPLSMMNIMGTAWGTGPGQQNAAACLASVGYDYIETFKLRMVMGRFYSLSYLSDSSDGVVVNEKAIKVLNLNAPLGQRLYVEGRACTIIGVIQDFHFLPKVFEIKPLILRLAPHGSGWIFVKMKTGDDNKPVAMPATVVRQVAAVFKELSPNFPFEYKYLNEFEFKEAQMINASTKVIIGFTIFGIFVAALGLFGLTSFLVEQRSQEIGVRKILGASRFTVLKLLAKEFFKLILIANLIAWPISYIVETMQSHLFAYPIDFAYWMFAVAGLSLLLIAFGAIYFQVNGAAAKNPVESLRYE